MSMSLDTIEALCPCPLYCGANALQKLPAIVARSIAKGSDGNPAGLIVTTKGMVERGQLRCLLDGLAAEGLSFQFVYAGKYPSLVDLQAAGNTFRGKVSWIVSAGGGSALDTGKVLSALLAKGNAQKKLASLLAREDTLSEERLPLWAVPTTSGSGAEVTPFATVWDTVALKKYSLENSVLIPDAVVLDHTLTHTMPRSLSCYTALDACSHALESLWNKNATDESAVLAQNALEGFCQAMPAILANQAGDLARDSMQKASFAAGLAISRTHTAIAHAISYPLTLHFGVPHGLACSFLLVRIAHLVTEADAWYQTTDMNLIERTIGILEGASLGEQIARYCSMEAIRGLSSGMLTKGRSDNFVLGSSCLESLLCPCLYP